MGKATGDDVTFVTQALGRGAQGLPQLREVMATAVAQFDVLEIVPNTLVRIKIGGIAGQAFQREA